MLIRNPHHEQINTMSAFDMMERISGMSELGVGRYAVIRKSEIDLLLMLSPGALKNKFKQHSLFENERKCYFYPILRKEICWKGAVVFVLDERKQIHNKTSGVSLEREKFSIQSVE